MDRKKILIVIPSYNEESNIEIMVNTLHEVMHGINYNYSILFVDDGSTDNSLSKLELISQTDKSVFFVALSRNFGHQNALKAGVDIASKNADAVITMDGDMQHPPKMILQLLKKWEEGFDIVYTIREDNQKQSVFKNKTSKLFYWFMNKLSDIEIEPGTADFRLMDKKVALVFSDFSENELFIRGMVNWVGFSKHGIKYQPDSRFSGSSKYTLSKMIRFALQGITSFSTKPLHIAIFIGLGTTILALIGFMIYVFYSLYFGHVISGWPSLISTVIFFGGLNLVVLGIIGIYIGKLFTQSKGRPNYIINKTNFLI